MCVVFKGKKNQIYFLNAIHNKNTCGYNDDRLLTEQTHRIEFTIEPGGEEEKKNSSHKANRRLSSVEYTFNVMVHFGGD